MTHKLYPLLPAPAYQDYIWGGRRIPDTFGRRDCPAVCAESWEVSDRPEGMSIVTNGVFRGHSLAGLGARFGTALWGKAWAGDRFPLLIKLIDAADRLSVQVHPDENTASRYGGEPKTECWHVLEAQPGAHIYAGLKARTTPQAFEVAIRQNTVETLLHAIPASTGDTLFIPGGRVHAIGTGCLLLEVQQNSNTTYRVYDWARVTPSGVPRPLHVQEALHCINFDDERPGVHLPAATTTTTSGNTLTELVRSPFFVLKQMDMHCEETVEPDGTTFHALFVKQGRVRMAGCNERHTLGPGTSCIIPATAGPVRLTPEEDGAVIIDSTLPHIS
jgi:mannose-6-phosphate isomerase